VPVHWLKKKYSTPKTAGRYRSSHNDSSKSQRRKLGDVARAAQQATQPTKVLVVLSSGKKRMVTVRDD